MKINYTAKWWHALLLFTLLIQLWPILFMLSTSLKDLTQIFNATLNPIPFPPTLDNYQVVLGKFPFFSFLFNSLVIAVIITVSKVITSMLAGFAFVYYKFKFKESIFNLMLLTFFIPLTVLVLPNYLFISKIGLLNSPWAVALPALADGMGIFLMRQTIRGIPKSLLEVARLDNISPVKTLTKIIIPLIRPSVIAISIIFFINSWNDYFWPMMVLQDKDSYTLPLALQMFISAEGGSEWGVAMAVATLTTLPPLVLYVICQRYILNTFLQSGVKG